MGTVLLCIFSSVAFCICLRGLIAIASLPRPLPGLITYSRKGFSAEARRMARQYTMFSLGVLALVSAFGVVTSFIELFIQFGAKGF